MLTSETRKQIIDFVSQKPRTVQEIAKLLSKNWRTAESYVQKIAQEQGVLATRTFREGTRGALKVVYWNVLNKNQSTIQQRLFHKLLSTRHKEDFSPFDIFQYVNEDRRECFMEKQTKGLNIKHDVIGTISEAEKQLLLFSGDLSWAQAMQGKNSLLKAFEKLAKKNVPIKILTNVDLNSLENVQKVESLNNKFGKEFIDIRHCEQPVRGFIIDKKLVRMKENYFLKESAKKRFLFYTITDEDWIEWLQKVFWHLFSTSISAKRRIENLQSIQEI